MTDKELLTKIKTRIDMRLNNQLCEMKPDFDDSITGFNEAWEIVSKTFHEVLGAPYGHMCRDPNLCAGKGYCPRDPTCGD